MALRPTTSAPWSLNAPPNRPQATGEDLLGRGMGDHDMILGQQTFEWNRHLGG